MTQLQSKILPRVSARGALPESWRYDYCSPASRAASAQNVNGGEIARGQFVTLATGRHATRDSCLTSLRGEEADDTAIIRQCQFHRTKGDSGVRLTHTGIPQITCPLWNDLYDPLCLPKRVKQTQKCWGLSESELEFKPVLCVWLAGYENIVWIFTLDLDLHSNGTQRFQQRANKCTLLIRQSVVINVVEIC